MQMLGHRALCRTPLLKQQRGMCICVSFSTIYRSALKMKVLIKVNLYYDMGVPVIADLFTGGKLLCCYDSLCGSVPKKLKSFRHRISKASGFVSSRVLIGGVGVAGTWTVA